MNVHQNSIDAYYQEEPRLSRRALAICDWLEVHGPATDRQIMQALGFREPNAVRPRITELIDMSKVREVRSTRCPVTGKTVRVVDVPRAGQRVLFDSL